MSVIKKQAAFDDLDTIDTILGLIKQLEATVLGLQQLRGYAGTGVGQEMLEGLIEEGEAKIVEVKRKLYDSKICESHPLRQFQCFHLIQ